MLIDFESTGEDLGGGEGVSWAAATAATAAATFAVVSCFCGEHMDINGGLVFSFLTII